MKLGLKVLSEGSQQGKVLPVTLTQFLIGRDPQCQLRPASPSISKRHCAVLVREGKVFIRDFDSTNGTFLNDKPVKGEVEIKHKDVLKAGPLLFEVLIVKEKPAPSVSEPTPIPGADNKETTATEKKAEPKKAAAEGGGEEDSIADLLLSLGDEDAPSQLSDEDVPEGSTVMEMQLPPEMTGEDGGEEGEEQKDPSKLEKEKEKQANTSNAAKAILDKYMRRPR